MPGPVEVRADALRLGQALGNLVDNALRYGAGDIVLRARRAPGGVVLEVSDQGPGFAPDIAGRAFERFARGDGARTRGGTGLGMAIVRAVAEAHGARPRSSRATAPPWLSGCPTTRCPAALRGSRGRCLTRRAASQTDLTFGPYGAGHADLIARPDPHDAALVGGSSPPALPQGSESVKLDPQNFTTRIDNRYWPMTPGSRWIYREDGENGRTQRVTVTVTHRTRKVAAGVRARVVRDVVTQGGRVIERTSDWYAQDRAGNVWYLVRTPPSSPNAAAPRARARGRPAATGPRPGSSCPPIPVPGCVTARSTTPGTRRTAPRWRASTVAPGCPTALRGRPRHARLQSAEQRPGGAQVLRRGDRASAGVSGGGSREALVSFHRG